MTNQQREREIAATVARIREIERTPAPNGNYARKRQTLDTLRRALADLMVRRAA